VWKAAIELGVHCYEATKVFPKEETYGMTAQIRRAAASVPANIAEGHGGDGTAHFVQFLRVAQGSLKELETHLILSNRVGLLDGPRSKTLLDECDEIGRMTRALIRTLQDKQ
jgi:four helix bundle protein